MGKKKKKKKKKTKNEHKTFQMALSDICAYGKNCIFFV